MGRKVTVGVVPGGIGQLSVENNTVRTVDTNSNLSLTANGTGIVQVNNSTTFIGDITINAQGDIRLADADSSNYVAIQAPATIASNYTITLPAAISTSNNHVLTSDTLGNTTWAAPRPFVYSVQTTGFNAVASNGYFVNTSGGGVTATLPSSPAVGDSIRFLDAAKTFDTNAFIVARNGQLIQGDADNLTVTSESAAFELIFSGATFGWRIFSI
jgi:hypothetical protein